MKNSNYICHVSYLRNSIAYDYYFWYSCVNDGNSRGFFNFFEIFIFSFFVSQELYLICLWFLVQMCKMMISPAIVVFSFFQNSDFLGFSKFINKCQKKVMRCAPPSSHVCDFSYILVSLKKGVHMECNEIFRSNLSFSYKLGPHEEVALLLVQQWVN